jgi:hypothetical protein
VQTEAGEGPAAVHALAAVAGAGGTRLLSASVALEGTAPLHEVRYTTDGAALLVGDRVVASLAADAPKSRIPPSAPPDRRDPFRR